MLRLSGNQCPDLQTSLMNMSLVLRLPREMHLCRSSSNVPHLPSFLDMLQNPNVLLTLTRCTIPCTCHLKRRLNLQKNVPRKWCFAHFDFEMCFAPQRRAIVHLSSGQLAPHPPLSSFSRTCIFFFLTLSLL